LGCPKGNLSNITPWKLIPFRNASMPVCQDSMTESNYTKVHSHKLQIIKCPSESQAWLKLYLYNPLTAMMPYHWLCLWSEVLLHFLLTVSIRIIKFNSSQFLPS
jgi:hypothetical protein